MRKYKEVEFDDSALCDGTSPVVSSAEAREYLSKTANRLIDKAPCDETKSEFGHIMKMVVNNAAFQGNPVTLVDIDKLNPKTNIKWIVSMLQALGYLVKLGNHGLWITVK
ncbi:orf158 [Lactobacillus phage LP65]|uniref:Orf158 n=1 Tax=Lactobacillus phage LP65 TaxID=2892344 RepID=Q5ULF6_9CAUD|nr:hypothetical protein LP65_gp158 [Lactobacillus phage LP65]AAV35978.1 orf158 [Lactobacillus phage LP65]